MNIAGFLDRLRNDTSARSLDEKNVDEDPFVQFKRWFDDAQKARILEPTAMILATATRKGKPSARVVLMKGVDERGVLFFTNYTSRKGKELVENPNAALLFFWAELGRQVRIEGRVTKASREESAEYFSTRPRDSQIGAWASEQSRVIVNRGVLESRVREFAARFGKNGIPTPAQWGGFRLDVSRFEFWQGRVSRLHDRIVYERKTKGWRIVRLSP